MFENDGFIAFSKKKKSCNITSLTLKLEVGVILQSSDLLDDQKECLLPAFLQNPKSLKEDHSWKLKDSVELLSASQNLFNLVKGEFEEL